MTAVTQLSWLEPLKTEWIERLDAQRLGHAPLIHGPRGIGKHLLADELVKLTLCLNRQGDRPCGACRSCELIEAGTHPDLMMISPEEEGKEITVDQIRALTEGLSLTPSVSPYRLGLIHPAEAMNANAANALLKTLEEPPDDAWVVLVSHVPQKLMPTILSRTQQWTVKPPSAELAMRWLRTHQPDAENQVLDVALQLASGGPLRASELLDSGDVELSQSVFDVLARVAQGQGAPPEVAEQWSDRAPTIWRLLAFWMGEGALTPYRESGPSDSGAFGSEAVDWWAMWHKAIEGLSQSDSGIRQDLLLGQWLLEWQSQFEKHQSA